MCGLNYLQQDKEVMIINFLINLVVYILRSILVNELLMIGQQMSSIAAR